MWPLGAESEADRRWRLPESSRRCGHLAVPCRVAPAGPHPARDSKQWAHQDRVPCRVAVV